MKTRSTASVTRAIVPRASRCPGWHHGRMPAIPPGVADAPRAPFVTLSALWLVLTGTLCNLRCTHCLNASGPDEPWLAPLDGAVARRALLRGLGIAKPRVKILPVFPVGRAAGAPGVRLTDTDLEGFDRTTLQCAETRVVAADGVYACPILAGLPGARLSDGALAAALGPAALYHEACATCHRTGATCRHAWARTGA